MSDTEYKLKFPLSLYTFIFELNLTFKSPTLPHWEGLWYMQIICNQLNQNAVKQAMMQGQFVEYFSFVKYTEVYHNGLITSLNLQ